MGISDLMVEAPPKETNDATGGTTESGHLRQPRPGVHRHPARGRLRQPVSVSVDLSIAGDQTTLVFTPPACSPAGHRRPAVPDDKQQRCWTRSARLPDQRLPFGVAPTSEGARGSDVIIEGITDGVTITLDGFKQS